MGVSLTNTTVSTTSRPAGSREDNSDMGTTIELLTVRKRRVVSAASNFGARNARKWGSRDPVPKAIFFDMNLVTVPTCYELDIR